MEFWQGLQPKGSLGREFTASQAATLVQTSPHHQ